MKQCFNVYFLSFLCLLILTPCLVRAEINSAQEFSARNNYLSVGFNYGTITQSNYPKLHSDIGATLSVKKDYWLFSTKSKRFRIGVDVAWLSMNYLNYKVNANLFNGGVARYDLHQGDIGIQVGAGMCFNISQHLRLRANAAWNPAFSGIYNDKAEGFHGAFGNFGTAGLMLSWRNVGVGFDVRMGKASYKNIFVFDEDESVGGDDFNPFYSEDGKKVNTTILNLRTTIVLTF